MYKVLIQFISISDIWFAKSDNSIEQDSYWHQKRTRKKRNQANEASYKLQKSKNQTQPIDPSLSFTKTHFSEPQKKP
jgi:hypothetical protein